MVDVTLAMKNNLALLLVISWLFLKFARWTKWKWDDALAVWFRNKITKTSDEEVVQVNSKQQVKEL